MASVSYRVNQLCSAADGLEGRGAVVPSLAGSASAQLKLCCGLLIIQRLRNRLWFAPLGGAKGIHWVHAVELQHTVVSKGSVGASKWLRRPGRTTNQPRPTAAGTAAVDSGARHLDPASHVRGMPASGKRTRPQQPADLERQEACPARGAPRWLCGAPESVSNR